jgi:hypothetical protein
LKRIVIISKLSGAEKEKAMLGLVNLVGGFLALAIGTQYIGTMATQINTKLNNDNK